MQKVITIDNPKKILEGELAGMYVCEVYLPDTRELHPIYASSIIDATDYANRFVEAYLKRKISRIEILLKEKDIRQRLTEELHWANKELAEKQRKS